MNECANQRAAAVKLCSYYEQIAGREMSGTLQQTTWS